MITKERIQELIEKEATVYYVKHRDTNFYIKPLELQKTYKAEYIYSNLMLDEEDLYEHKADAEWDLEFDNVEKRIKFVKPKPFRDIKKSMITLYNAHGFAMYLDSMDNYVRVYDERIDFYERDLIFQKPFTEENYTEACRLIKKLFMGDK